MSKNTEIVFADSSYEAILQGLKDNIRAAQARAALFANQELIQIYWNLGKTIVSQQRIKGWGSSFIERLSKDLSAEFVGIKGFSRANLFKIKQWYNFHSDGEEEKAAQLVRQIPWSHNMIIIHKVKDVAPAYWYIEKTIERGWSRNMLMNQIESKLYEREATSRKITNFKERLSKVQSELAEQVLKDPYVFDFMNLSDAANERDIEKELVRHIQKFLLELGTGFSFLGNQYHLEIGGDDFYIDMLFYHVKLHAYLVVEIKTGKFQPEHAGKLGFYLSAIDDMVKTPQDNPTIGLLLCKDKNNITAEYALRGMNQPIGISEYKITESLPSKLRAILPSIAQIEAELSKPGSKKEGQHDS